MHKIFNGYVAKFPQCVTFTCSYCHFKGKPIDIVEILGLQNALFKSSIDHSLFEKGTLKASKYMRDLYMRLDVLSLAIIW